MGYGATIHFRAGSPPCPVLKPKPDIYKTVILHGLTPRWKNVCRECLTAVLKRIFEPENSNYVTGGWSVLHNKELHNVCFLPNIIRVIT